MIGFGLLALCTFVGAAPTGSQSQRHSHVHPLSSVPRPLGYGVLHDVGVKVTASPSVVTTDNSEVTVSWTGMSYAQSYDWVGVWCGKYRLHITAVYIRQMIDGMQANKSR